MSCSKLPDMTFLKSPSNTPKNEETKETAPQQNTYIALIHHIEFEFKNDASYVLQRYEGFFHIQNFF